MKYLMTMTNLIFKIQEENGFVQILTDYLRNTCFESFTGAIQLSYAIIN